MNTEIYLIMATILAVAYVVVLMLMINARVTEK